LPRAKRTRSILRGACWTSILAGTPCATYIWCHRHFECMRPMTVAPRASSLTILNEVWAKTGFWPETGRLLLGIVALAIVTGLYFWLGLSLVSAAFTYLIVIVLLSLASTLPSLLALSFIAVGLLNYFFAPPIFSLHIEYEEDIITIAAFLITSFIITGLVRRVQIEEREHLQDAEKLRETQLLITHVDRLATMGQLAGSIAHEIRQPLTGIVTNAAAALRWLDHRPPNMEQIREGLNQIVKDGKHASDVMDSIRALIKKAPLQKRRFEINGAVLEVIALTHGEAVKNGVSVKAELADGLPLVQGDRVQVQQVVLNLIINAVEATKAISEGERQVLIGTAKDESRSVVVTVRDSGPGMAAATLDRLFQPFYTTKPNGLGLGLSICRSIVEAHCGRLWATSSAGCGAIFQFSLPVD
jgi:signal transduction histidine kinase